MYLIVGEVLLNDETNSSPDPGPQGDLYVVGEAGFTTHPMVGGRAGLIENDMFCQSQGKEQ